MHQDVPALVLLLRELQLPEHQKEAEEALAKMDDSNPHMLQLLKIVLVSDLEDVTQLSAATYLNTLLLDRLDSTEPIALLQFFSSYLLTPGIKNLHKRILERFSIALLSKLNAYLVEELIVSSKQLLQSKQLDSVFMLMGAFAVSDAKPAEFYRYTRETFRMPLELLASNINNEFAMAINEWAKSMIQVMDKLTIDKDEEQSPQGTALAIEIANQPLVSKIIHGAFQLGSNVGHLITTAAPLLQLNLLKYEVCERTMHLDNLVQLRLLTPCPDVEDTACPAFQLANQIIPFFLNSLAIVASDQSLVETYECQDFVVSMMKVLRCLIRKSVFYAVFSNIAQNILEKVLVPLMAIQEEQLILFRQSASEFHSLAEDTCENQTYESMKTQAASVLEALADYVDGFVSKVVSVCLESLTVQFGLRPQQGKGLLSKEEAFLILSVLSCQISSRNDLLFEIRTFLANSKAVLSQLNELELSRLYIFLSYNFIELFDDELELGTPYLQSAFGRHTHPTVEHIALDFIFNQTENYCSIDLFVELFDRTLVCEVGILWDIFQMYVTKKMSLLSEPILMQLVDSLYKRVDIDLGKILRNETDNSLLLIKSLNVVHEVAKNTSYLRDKPFVSDKIWSIIDILKHLHQIEFEDDIIGILTAILEQKEEFEEREMALLPYIEAIFQKYKLVYNCLFKPINLFILNSPFTEENGVAIRLLKLCVLGLNPTYEKKQNEDVGEALLLLQLMLSKAHKLLPVATLTEVAGVLKNVITSTKSAIVRARVFNSLALMYPRLDCREVFPLVIAKAEQFSGYDRTVLIFALCSSIMEESDPAMVAQLISIAVHHLSLQAAKIKEKTKPKEEKLKILSMGRKGSKRKYKPDASFLKSVENLRSPWKGLDKFEYFKNTLETMRRNNEHMYNVIVEQLSEATRTALREVSGVLCVSNKLRKIIKVRRDVFRADVHVEEQPSEMVDEGTREREDLDDEDGNKEKRKRRKEEGKNKMKKKF